jgi:curved DNA-binding protein CbpA
MKTKFQACQILAVDINATPAQIKDAYRNLARQWHPDRFIDLIEKQTAEERFKQINAAYEYLKKEIEAIDIGFAQSSNVKSDVKSTVKPTAKRENSSAHLTAEELYQEAANLGKNRHYEEAIVILGLAIKLSPRYSKAYRYRGFIRSVLGFEMSAEADFRRARAIDVGLSPQAPVSSPGPKT